MRASRRRDEQRWTPHSDGVSSHVGNMSTVLPGHQAIHKCDIAGDVTSKSRLSVRVMGPLVAVVGS